MEKFKPDLLGDSLFDHLKPTTSAFVALLSGFLNLETIKNGLKNVKELDRRQIPFEKGKNKFVDTALELLKFFECLEDKSKVYTQEDQKRLKNAVCLNILPADPIFILGLISKILKNHPLNDDQFANELTYSTMIDFEIEANYICDSCQKLRKVTFLTKWSASLLQINLKKFYLIPILWYDQQNNFQKFKKTVIHLNSVNMIYDYIERVISYKLATNSQFHVVLLLKTDCKEEAKEISKERQESKERENRHQQEETGKVSSEKDITWFFVHIILLLNDQSYVLSKENETHNDGKIERAFIIFAMDNCSTKYDQIVSLSFNHEEKIPLVFNQDNF